MVLPFKELSLVGRCKASIQMFVFYSTECEGAMRGEVGRDYADSQGELVMKVRSVISRAPASDPEIP